MAKIFLSLLAFLFSFSYAFSVDQIPFPLENTSLFVLEGGSSCPGFLAWCYSIEYRYEGDTVIN